MTNGKQVTFRGFVQLAAISSLVLIGLPSAAQTFPDRGFLPGESFDFSAKDDVNLLSGNMIYRVPIYKFPPGPAGQSLQVDLVYNSFIYDVDPLPNDDPAVLLFPSTTGGSWRYSYEFSLTLDPTLTRPTVILPDGSRHTLYLRGYSGDAQSTVYGYNPATGGETMYWNGCFAGVNTPGGTLVYYTADATFIRLELYNVSGSCSDGSYGQNWTLFLPDGTRVSGTGVMGDANKIQDRNGNTINIMESQACDPSDGVCGTDSTEFVITDQLGRVFSKTTTYTEGNPMDVLCAPSIVSGANNTSCTGSQVQWNVQWQRYSATGSYYNQSDTSHPIVPSGIFVSSVQLPSTSTATLSYQFTYDLDPGWGEMQTATTPYGLTTTYQYACEDYSANGCYPQNPYYRFTQVSPNVPLGTKTLTWHDPSGNQQSQSVNYVWSSPGSFPSSVIVTAPDGGQTTHQACAAGAGFGKECATTLPDGDSISRTWQEFCTWGAPGPYQMLGTETSMVGGQTSSTTYQYDRNGNTVQMVESSNTGWSRTTQLMNGSTPGYFITTGAPGPIGYPPSCGHTSGTVTQDLNAFWSALSQYGGTLAGWTLDAPVSKTITDSYGHAGAWSYAYNPTTLEPNNSGATSANVTGETTGTGSGAVTTSHTYDANGNLLSTTDAKNVETLFTMYGQCALNGVSPPYAGTVTQDATGPLSRTTTQTWDCNSGLLTQSTDPNQVVTGYSYDAIGRKTLLDEAMSTSVERQTNISYAESSSNTPLVVTTTRPLDSPAMGNRTVTEIQTYDQRGQLALTQNTDTVQPYISVQQFGRIGIQNDSKSYELVSNPYRTTSDNTAGWTRTQYDTNGRVVEVDHFDAAALNGALPCPFTYPTPATCSGAAAPASWSMTAWNGYTGTVTDEAGVSKVNTYDSLGHLVAVQENPAGSGPTTSYTYDYGDRLLSAGQGTQTRSFVYDQLGRLTMATNPETGTIQYGYDNNGNLTSRTDNRGVVTDMSYDDLNRVIGKTYPGSSNTSSVVYCYDGLTSSTGCSSAPTGPFMFGRLTMQANSTSTTNNTSFDALGRVLASNQVVAGGTFDFTYQYNALDRITSESYPYPSNLTVTTNYDNAGRAVSVSQGTGQNYVSSIGYAANNAVNSLPLGNGVTENTSFNTRFQVTGITAGSLLTLGYTYGLSAGPCNAINPTGVPGTMCDNGNVLTASVAWGGTAFSQYFLYDPINRILGAEENPSGAPTNSYPGTFSCGTGVNWCEAYGYPDTYGNRLIAGTVGLSVPVTPTGFDPATNRNMGGGPNNNAWVPSTSYDAAGNVVVDGSGSQYTYDAENRQLSAQGASYAYDGDGHRVVRTTATNTATYIYDATGNMALEYDTQTPVVTGTEYLTADALGSTRLITAAGNTVLNGVPQTAAAEIECLDYLPFGDYLTAARTCPTGQVGVAQDFTGKERDSETGLDYFGARYMSSAQGRFTSPDPGGVGADPGSPQTWNMYSYTGNNPLSAIDPNGLDCVYTSDQTDKSITVTVERGNCSQNTGTFVNGTIDTNALTYNGKSLDLGYTDANGAAGVFSKNLGPAVYEYPGIEGPANRAGAALIGSSQSMINAFAAADAAFAVGYLATYAPAAIGAVRTAQAARAAAQAGAALKAAQLALKALPADQYKLLQQWLGPIKAGSPITPPPPGLTADAMQRYLAVAQAYIAAGGSGAAIQATRIQALNNALGNK